jgi:hypothetical protein
VKATIIHEGEYRASDGSHPKWRIVQKQGGIGVEVEDRQDAMGKPVYSVSKAYEVNGAAVTILAHLVNMVKKKEKLPTPDALPAIVASGEVPQANTEKAKLQWRLVKTERGIVAEEEQRRDLLGEVVFGAVATFASQGGSDASIFSHLLKLVS